MLSEALSASLTTCLASLCLIATQADPDTAAPHAKVKATDIEVKPETPSASAQPSVIRAGTMVSFLTNQEITSKRARKGDQFTLRLAEPLVIDGREVLPKGTVAVAELTQARGKGFMGQGGKLAARMVYLELPSGPVRFSGRLGTPVGSNDALVATASVLTGGLVFFATGKSAVIAKDTPLSVRLDRDARIPASDPSQTDAAQAD